MYEVPEQLIGAVKLFLQEFDSHLNCFNSVLSSYQQQPQLFDSLTDEQFAKERRLLEQRFHTIKGSAGFFKFTEIRDIAQTGEKLFRAATHKGEYVEALKTSLPELTAKLAKFFDELSREFGPKIR